jgi:hypothetical protein
MSALFDACRRITAQEAAVKAGLPLKRSGSRWFACCPFHRERTPSLCFFPDGGYKCFGCGLTGDAVSFYSALYSLSPMDAALRLAGDFGLCEPACSISHPPPKTEGRDLMRAVDTWKAAAWDRLCKIRHQAAQLMDTAQAACAAPGDCWDSETLMKALEARDAAEICLNMLECATPAQLLKWAAGGGG